MSISLKNYVRQLKGMMNDSPANPYEDMRNISAAAGKFQGINSINANINFDQLFNAAQDDAANMFNLAFEVAQETARENASALPGIMSSAENLTRKQADTISDLHFQDLERVDPEWRESLNASSRYAERFAEDIAPEIFESAGELAAGELPQDVIDQVTDSSAWKALQGMGTVDSPAAANLTLKDLGLTTLEGIQQGAQLGGYAAQTGQNLESNYLNTARGLMPQINYGGLMQGNFGTVAQGTMINPGQAMNANLSSQMDSRAQAMQGAINNAQMQMQADSQALDAALSYWGYLEDKAAVAQANQIRLQEALIGSIGDLNAANQISGGNSGLRTPNWNDGGKLMPISKQNAFNF